MSTELLEHADYFINVLDFTENDVIEISNLLRMKSNDEDLAS